MPLWHALSTDRCLELVGAKPSGLSSEEARRRLDLYGPNELPRPRRTRLALRFLRQFRSPLIYLLLIVALVSLALGHWLDAGFILIVLAINATIGTVQEHKADIGLSALERLIRHTARVRRDGIVRLVEAADLAPGDVVELESGMAVPADLRLLSASGLRADESLLSGESLPVAKESGCVVEPTAGLGDRPTMLHAGTSVAEGRAVGLVVATGSATALGEIQASLRQAAAAAPPPLVLRLARLTRQIAVAAIGLIVPLAVLLALDGQPAGDVLLLAVALAVSAIPEGLPIAVTVALAAATRRMARRNVIVRTLPAVEGLGACTLIASDKTGTLTLNRLSLERVLLADGLVLEPADWRGEDKAEALPLAWAAAYCNEATLGPQGVIVGDTVDVALAEFARQSGVDLREAASAARVAALPYEPCNKFSAVVIGAGGQMTAYVKGAPEVVLPMCGKVPDRVAAMAEGLAGEGYRLLAIACGEFSAGADGPVPTSHFPIPLRLLGWVALLDPVRPEAAEAVARCREAGISVRMITGDHPATALTIARQVGIAASCEDVVTGAELDALDRDPTTLARVVSGARVFARIEPSRKLEIVEMLSASGELVAVTGDGVNDAPALQAAHIGVAMGQGGTDVARGAADLVLADDNFASIVAGIEEGRVTYANIRKIVIFLLATGIAEISMFLGALAAGLPMPLTAVQLLWLNLVTNGVQDVMLGLGRGEGDELTRPPRRPSDPILDRSAIALMVPPALAMTALALFVMDWAIDRGLAADQARNAVLLLVVLFQNAYVLAMRSERRPIWREPVGSSPWLLVGVALALGLHLLAMHWQPLQSVLGTSPVSSEVVALCLGGVALTLVVTELSKSAVRRRL